MVAISTTQIETGFIQVPERTTVLDPKLNTKNIGNKFMFRTKEKEPSYNICGFKMNDFSTAYGKQNMIAEFKGVPVLMKDMDMLYWSKDFYISNITVSDLH